MSKNHTIRGCKGLEKKRETRNFLYVDQTIATFVCHSIRENSGNEVANLRGGGGWWDLGGGSPQKNGLKGGGHPKKNGGKGGVTRNILVHVELT